MLHLINSSKRSTIKLFSRFCHLDGVHKTFNTKTSCHFKKPNFLISGFPVYQKPSGYSSGVPNLIPTFLSLWVRNTIFNTNTHNTCGTYSFGTRTNVNYSRLKHSYMEHSCWEHSHIACGTQPCGRLVFFWISYSCRSECNLWYQVLNIPLYLLEEMLWNCYKTFW